MNSNNEKKELLSAYLEKHPFLQEIGQLHTGAEAILAELEVEDFSLPSLSTYAEDFKQGIPLLQHADFQVALGNPVENVMRKLIQGLLKKNVPEALKGFCRSLEGYLANNAAAEMIGYVLCQEEDSVRSFCEKKGLNANALSYIVWLAVSQVLVTLEKEKDEWQKDLNWDRNYCPVCGSLPVLAQLKKKNQGRERHLVCGNCHTTWHYKRIGCVCCGNEELNTLRLLESEVEPEMRIDVCDECQSYIKTYLNEGKEAIYLADWTTLHLDMVAEKEGLKRKGNSLI
ncbi:MAG: formate dehydrogenase [Massilibacillus sp.]|jgi:FdhE protein|nr:formate dehydrogenase [Massilibacillus sp.]